MRSPSGFFLALNANFLMWPHDMWLRYDHWLKLVFEFLGTSKHFANSSPNLEETKANHTLASSFSAFSAPRHDTKLNYYTK